MSELRLAGLKVHLNDSALTKSGEMAAAVVLLHGFGAPGTDLVALGDVLNVPKDTAIFFPEGPIDLGAEMGSGYSGARAWWPIDMAKLQVAMMTGQFQTAAKDLRDWNRRSASEGPGAPGRVTVKIRSEIGSNSSGGILSGRGRLFGRRIKSSASVRGTCPNERDDGKSRIYRGTCAIENRDARICQSRQIRSNAPLWTCRSAAGPTESRRLGCHLDALSRRSWNSH